MENQETRLRSKIDSAFAPLGPLLWGVCGATPHLAMPNSFTKAVVIVAPFAHKITLEGYSEAHYRNLQLDNVSRRREMVKALNAVLDAEGIRHQGSPHTDDGETFERNMTEAFSTKEAARLAGLGWIGKSSLLVTPEFGPRLSMTAVLCDIPLTPGTPIEKSRCGACSRCQDYCACQAIYGKLWEPGLTREQLVDFPRCSKFRFSGYEKLGRKTACGMCAAVCPFGSAYVDGVLPKASPELTQAKTTEMR